VVKSKKYQVNKNCNYDKLHCEEQTYLRGIFLANEGTPALGWLVEQCFVQRLVAICYPASTFARRWALVQGIPGRGDGHLDLVARIGQEKMQCKCDQGDQIPSNPE
jgi:hypothetical protein